MVGESSPAIIRARITGHKEQPCGIGRRELQRGPDWASAE